MTDVRMIGGVPEIKSDPALLERLMAPTPDPTPEEIRAQRISWVVGQGGYDHEVVERRLDEMNF
jgi:hypothetical protein